MRRNIEIKAKISDLTAITERVNAIADCGPTLIDHEDTFFRSSRGRLKLRKFSDSKGELIYYDRPDSIEPSECRYIRSSISAPGEIIEILSRSIGIRGVVRKRRTIYVIGQTRIHLDEVEGLGKFIELEVVLLPGQGATEGVRIARDLIDKLGILEPDLVDKAYIDLLNGGVG
ncbi:MAG: CYTH domain-containing protein [Candidatus Latescibacteria bacterium]|nr:CYTH domain-containing protein [Candidatus Latescibacterota bacterium]NIO27103.1 CYTH domain-containing protein [Candidatus Latescibacterota bacterium]NIO54627.1 CYTH domain-containing protein [Candidatus Latescibacterota bacterium]NIT00710.1 CYTH domain-containing protein [Candidatus Latescibacterota bacterium]NIT37633.1 CYTH domain-containing protein [Candidatus Latescibacterota bacterium]